MFIEEGRGAGSSRPSQTIRPPRRGPQILIADDEAHVAGLMARALRAKGFSIELAGGARDGIARALEREYGLVLLDPRRDGAPDGLELLEALRRARPQQRVMVVSAQPRASVRVRCLELGAADVLVKPFDVAELVARAAARAGAPVTPQRADERFLRVGAITLDLFRHTVDAGTGHGPVGLSLREFELLRCFMRHAGLPCTREQLLDEVWDADAATATNVVDVYVHRLRHKLGGRRIETLRNVGYLLEPA